MNKSFAFCVLAYNHSKYIIEHLESIKFLVVNYGGNREIHLVLSDDGSSDGTRELINLWLAENEGLFFKEVKIFNELNLGTCECLIRIAKQVEAQYCKITAGDDVYTSEDIFAFADEKMSAVDLVSGIPLRLYEGQVKKSRFECFNYAASDLIYAKKNMDERLSDVSIINAPNLFYPVRYLKDSNVIDYLKDFDVVEDLPLQSSIARGGFGAAIVSTYVTLVLYRRTAGSTVIVENDRFVRDQLRSFDRFIEYFSSKGDRLRVALIKNRMMAFVSRSRFVKLVFNLSYYIYALRVLGRIVPILNVYYAFKPDLKNHQAHYNKIKEASIIFFEGRR